MMFGGTGSTSLSRETLEHRIQNTHWMSGTCVRARAHRPAARLGAAPAALQAAGARPPQVRALPHPGWGGVVRAAHEAATARGPSTPWGRHSVPTRIEHTAALCAPAGARVHAPPCGQARGDGGGLRRPWGLPTPGAGMPRMQALRGRTKPRRSVPRTHIFTRQTWARLRQLCVVSTALEVDQPRESSARLWHVRKCWRDSKQSLANCSRRLWLKSR